MATARFEHPIFVARHNFIEEIAGLDDVFDFLEEWPEHDRGVAFNTLADACRRAAAGSFPVSAARENFRRFVKQAGMLANLEDVPNFSSFTSDWNIGGA
jgi:ribosomal 50S subunit-associated protein YjgA (DUF615 family)